MNEKDIHSRIFPIDLLLIVVFCIAFFGYRLGSFVPLSDHEGLVAVTAQETLGGHWIVPHFDGQIRLQKTPLMYWTVASFAAVAGKLDEFIIRLPSALAATGLALVLTLFVGRMFGRFPGIITGLATASTAGILWQSHVGNADMLMTFFVTLCFYLLYLAIVAIDEGRPTLKYMIPAYIAFSLAMMAKGPVPAPTVLLPLFVYLLWTGYQRHLDKTKDVPAEERGCPFYGTAAGMWQYLRKMAIPLGIVIFILIVGGWVAAILFKVPNAIYRWNEEYIARCLGEFGTSRSFFYYFPQIFLLTLPWSVFLPLGLILPFRKEMEEKRSGLLLIFLWLVVGFFFFSTVSGKRSHYILPIVPPAIMLSTIGMIYAMEHWLSRRTIFFGGLIAVLLTIGGLLGGYYGFIVPNYPAMAMYYRILGSIFVFAEILAMMVYFRWNILASVTVLAVAIGICFAIIWPLVSRFEDIARDPKSAVERIKRVVGPDATLYFVGRANAPLVFYYGKTMPQIPEDQEVVQIFKEGSKELAILRLQDNIAQRIMKLVKQPKCNYFITSDIRFLVAEAYARKENVKIYEVLRIPGYFSESKGLVVFSNCAKNTTQPATAPE